MMNFPRVFLQYLVPQHLLSRLAGVLTNCQKTGFKNWLIDRFIKHYGVDMSTAIEPDPHHYATFNQFFTRKLRAETRPVVDAPHTIACPADGCVSQLGNITQGRMIQAKGFDYSVQQLLGGSAERAAPFAGGVFMTIYLAPKDYHRVHIPVAATLREMVYVPGQLFSVNPITMASVPNLFARNERVAMLFDTTVGPMAVVMVGAMLVASIQIAWEGVIAPSLGKTMKMWDYRGKQQQLAKGEELGHFQLGSTVIVLFGNDCARWLETLQPEQNVQFGQLLGYTNS